MINSDYLYSNTYSNFKDFIPEKGSTYFYGGSNEERSQGYENIQSFHSENLSFVALEIVDNTDSIIKDMQTNQKYDLLSECQMTDLFTKYATTTIYIDISGLPCKICAPLLKNAIQNISKNKINDIRIIYAEPETYKIKEFQSEGVFNDLSERIKGIFPLLGFSNIIEDDEEICFVPLLGFEGGRSAHIIENTPSIGKTIIPVIGLSGFRLEYPFVTYWGNRKILSEQNVWCKIRYATANSIVESYLILKQIHNDYSNMKLKIAPIGTKPHAIGAFLYAIKNPNTTELIYDNPIRTKQRTDGVGKIIETSITKLLEA